MRRIVFILFLAIVLGNSSNAQKSLPYEGTWLALTKKDSSYVVYDYDNLDSGRSPMKIIAKKKSTDMGILHNGNY